MSHMRTVVSYQLLTHVFCPEVASDEVADEPPINDLALTVNTPADVNVAMKRLSG